MQSLGSGLKSQRPHRTSCSYSFDPICHSCPVRLSPRRRFRMLCSGWTEATIASLEAATSRALDPRQPESSLFGCKVCGKLLSTVQHRTWGVRHQLHIYARAGASPSAATSAGQGNGNGNGSGYNSGGGGGGSGGSSPQSDEILMKATPHGSIAQTEDVILIDVSGEVLANMLSCAGEVLLSCTASASPERHFHVHFSSQLDHGLFQSCLMESP